MATHRHDPFLLIHAWKGDTLKTKKKSKSTYNREMSLSNWARMFRDIYFPLQNYGRSRFEVFTNLAKVFGAGSHYLFRTQDPKGAREYLAKLFAWYCALGNRLHLDIEQALWEKYPGVCPRCLSSVCECPAHPAAIVPEKLTMIALENARQRPDTLRDWQVMFASIYRGPSGKSKVPPSRDRLALVFARMAEELGEIAEGLGRDGTVDADADFVLRNEIADFGAWIFGLANNLHYVDPKAQGVMLADVAWDLYPAKCHRCRESKCICVRGSYGLELAEKGAMGPSHWDERTGLSNDRALRRYIEHATSQYGPGNYTWSLIFLDLDNFGLVNKQHSHEAGDIVLRSAAERMQEVVGDAGIVFRRGGEEFVVVLRQAKDSALVMAEAIRRGLAAKPVKATANGKNISIKVTASLGVASCISDADSPAALESLAEGRAKEAKKAGKNRVMPAPSEDLLIRSTTF
jgi:diguanylate cyclase (GGDEF)-like protein